MSSSRSGTQGGRFPVNPIQTSTQVPTDYLKGTYFDDKGKYIKGELLTTKAEELAKILGQSGIAYTQLRQFFMQVRSIERKIGQKEFAQLVPKITRLSALAAYFTGRGKDQYERQRREALKNFIDGNRMVAEKSEKQFVEGFVPHFEAIVAYYKYHFQGKD